MKVPTKIFRRSNQAAALLEFALIIPVLVGLIYMAYDMPKTRQINAQIKADISYAEQMIKAVGKTHYDQPKVTISDLRNIFKAIAISHNYIEEHNLKYNICFSITLIKGIGKNVFKTCWSGYTIFQKTLDNTQDFTRGDQLSKFSITDEKEHNTNEIGENISINPNDYKIILEIGINNYDENSNEPAFNLMLTEPKRVKNIFTVMMRQISIFKVDHKNFDETFPN